MMDFFKLFQFVKINSKDKNDFLHFSLLNPAILILKFKHLFINFQYVIFIIIIIIIINMKATFITTIIIINL